MKDFLNKITNLVRNKYAMQKFYFASLVALLLFYIPFSPLNYIDLESVWGRFVDMGCHCGIGMSVGCDSDFSHHREIMYPS